MNKKFNFKAIHPYIKPYYSSMVWMIVLGIMSSICDSMYPLFNRYALNHYVGLKTLDTFIYFIILYIITLIVQVIFNFISSYICAKIELDVGRDLKNASFNHLQTLSFSYFNQNNVGYIHARVMSDTDRIGTLISWRLMDFVWNFSYIVCVFIVMMIINIKLALILFLLIPISILFILYYQKHLLSLNHKIREINANISSNFNEGITGAKTIKTLVVEDKIQNNFEIDTHLMKKTSIRSTHYFALFSSTITIMSAIALALVMNQGGHLVMKDIMKIGTLSVFMSYALGMIEPIQYIIEVFSALIQARVNIERFNDLMHSESDVKDRKEIIEKYGDTFHPKKENWEPLIGKIEFKDVSFKYPDGEEYILEHFNLNIPQGTHVAIVGETGAGKSTLVNLVCRFFEVTDGQILIDDKDIRDRSSLWLHSHLGYVLQSPHLFSGTIRDNLKYANSEITDKQIIQALEIVGAKDIVDQMGLDAQVGESGDLLSTGEKQLLSFARALLANPSILILDEATSSIDTLTEKRIQEATEKVIQGRTVFTIAHRLSTIVNANIILCVRNGKIVEKGTHQELMNKKGYYYSLYTRQFQDDQTKVLL